MERLEELMAVIRAGESDWTKTRKTEMLTSLPGDILSKPQKHPVETIMHAFNIQKMRIFSLNMCACVCEGSASTAYERT